jgi:cytochrome bd-type quinol oxidase subunit 2
MGIVGTILLVGFLSTLLHLFTVVKLIPYLVGLNGLIIGFYLLEKTKDELRHKHVALLVISMIFVSVIFVVLNIFFLYEVGEYVLTIRNLIFYLIIAIFCTEFGALLAIKYIK